MVIRLLWLLALFAIPCISFGKDKCTKGSEFVPPLCPLRLEKISMIQIKGNGVRSDVALERYVDCSKFKLDTKKVLKFFSRAKAVDKQDAYRTLDASECYASGILKFSSGKQMHWTIGQLQEGWLGTEENDISIMLYCPTCKFRPFVY